MGGRQGEVRMRVWIRMKDHWGSAGPHEDLEGALHGHSSYGDEVVRDETVMNDHHDGAAVDRMDHLDHRPDQKNRQRVGEWEPKEEMR